jgi:hypothetical protein
MCVPNPANRSEASAVTSRSRARGPEKGLVSEDKESNVSTSYNITKDCEFTHLDAPI